MIDYTLSADEVIVCASTPLAATRLKRITKYTTCLRLVHPKSGICQYFIITRAKLPDLYHTPNLAVRNNFNPSMFVEMCDETVYRKRRAKKHTIKQVALFGD